MANLFYPKAKEGFATGAINWTSDNIRVILVDLADYTYNAAHDFLDDVPAGARVATSGNLTTKSATNGVLDADDVTFSSVTGDVSEALIIYQHTGTESTSRLILFFDTGVTNLPVTPNGGNITIAWDNGANKIAAL